MLGIVRLRQHLNHAVRSLLHLIIQFVLYGFLDFLHFHQGLLKERILLLLEGLASSTEKLGLLIERDLHAWIHPGLLELLGHCTLGLCVNWGCHRVPYRVHFTLHIRTLLQMLEVISLRSHRLLLHHGVLHKLHLLELSSYVPIKTIVSLLIRS